MIFKIAALCAANFFASARNMNAPENFGTVLVCPARGGEKACARVGRRQTAKHAAVPEKDAFGKNVRQGKTLLLPRCADVPRVHNASPGFSENSEFFNLCIEKNYFLKYNPFNKLQICMIVFYEPEQNGIKENVHEKNESRGCGLRRNQ